MSIKLANDKNQVQELNFLEPLRGIAAFVVLVGHARWLMWEGYSEGYLKHPETYSIIEKASVFFLSIFKFGHQAVMFFFILSGFVIHYKYSKNIYKKRVSAFNLKNFVQKRFFRIYPPLIFSMLLTLFLDYLGKGNGYLIYFNNTPNLLINANVHFNHTFQNFVGNIILIENSIVETWGSNSPVWSLKFEWWFYMLYPVLLFANTKSQILSVGFVISLFVGSFLFQSIPFLSAVMQNFTLWYIGSILADIYVGRIKIKQLYLIPFILFIPFEMLFQSHFNNFAGDLFWAIGFFGFLNLMFWMKEKGFQFSLLCKLSWVGACSYTIYIIHFPILVFLNGIVLNQNNNLMPHTQIFIYITVGFIICIAYLLHFLIEKPFQRLNLRTK